MSESDALPAAGAVRFTEDGQLEVFDGEGWAVYSPEPDDGTFGTVFKIGDDPGRQRGSGPVGR